MRIMTCWHLLNSGVVPRNLGSSIPSTRAEYFAANRLMIPIQRPAPLLSCQKEWQQGSPHGKLKRIVWVRLEVQFYNILFISAYIPHKPRESPTQSQSLSTLERLCHTLQTKYHGIQKISYWLVWVPMQRWQGASYHMLVNT